MSKIYDNKWVFKNLAFKKFVDKNLDESKLSRKAYFEQLNKESGQFNFTKDMLEKYYSRQTGPSGKDGIEKLAGLLNCKFEDLVIDRTKINNNKKKKLNNPVSNLEELEKVNIIQESSSLENSHSKDLCKLAKDYNVYDNEKTNKYINNEGKNNMQDINLSDFQKEVLKEVYEKWANLRWTCFCASSNPFMGIYNGPNGNPLTKQRVDMLSEQFVNINFSVPLGSYFQDGTSTSKEYDELRYALNKAECVVPKAITYPLACLIDTFCAFWVRGLDINEESEIYKNYCKIMDEEGYFTRDDLMEIVAQEKNTKTEDKEKNSALNPPTFYEINSDLYGLTDEAFDLYYIISDEVNKIFGKYL